MKLLILSADSSIFTWKTLDAKKNAISDALNLTKNATWEVEVKFRPMVPFLTKKGRITQTWYDTISHSYFNEGYQFIYLHFSSKQWKDYRLDRRIRGANQRDTDFVGESYGWSDENTKRGRKENQFVQNVLHEVSHEIARTTNVPDLTHKYHDATPDISGIFKSYDMSKWQPVYQKQMSLIASLIEKVKELMKPKPQTLLHPVPDRFRRVTQPYGVVNPIYKQTGHHIGTDWGTPVGTPLVAPLDGEIIVVGKSDVLGFFCHYRYTYEGVTYVERWVHLQEAPINGKYKRGQECAYTGNTGMSTGPHLHQDIWFKDVNVPILTASNFRNFTLDPEIHYGLK